MLCSNDDNVKLSYNFVFDFACYDYYEAIIGKELYHSDCTRVNWWAFKGSRISEKLFHFHWAYSVNRIVRLPLKKIWFRKMYNQGFTNSLPICFVFFGGNNLRHDGGFVEYVKKMNPDNKIVIWHDDLISRHIVDYEYQKIRDKADLCVSYDKSEAEKFGIEYFQETTYYKLIPEPEITNFEYDIYFLGAAKNRLGKIMDAYYFFKNEGLKCKFIIVGVPDSDRIESDDIEYRSITYKENIENIIKSKCILEIIQEGSVDITTRALEAIAYKRKFISDCLCDIESYFNENQFIRYPLDKKFRINSLAEEYDPNLFVPQIDTNPRKRLYFLQEKLNAL